MAVAIFVFLQPEVRESVEVVDDLLQVWLCLVFMQETTSFIYLFLLISRSISVLCAASLTHFIRNMSSQCLKMPFWNKGLC